MKKEKNLSFVYKSESKDTDESYLLTNRDHVYQIFLKPIYAKKTWLAWNGRDSDELFDTEEREGTFLDAVEISMSECYGNITEKNQQSMEKLQKLADELYVKLTITSRSVGFGRLTPKNEKTVLSSFSFDTDPDMCKYLADVYQEIKETSFQEGEYISLYVAIHEGIGGHYIQNMWSKVFGEVNLQTSEIIFTEQACGPNLLRDKKYDDLVYCVVDLIEEKLCQDGCLDTRYSDFVPYQHR